MKPVLLNYSKKLKRYYARIQIEGVRRRIWFGPNEKKAARELAEKLKSIAAGTVTFSDVTSTSTVDTEGHKDVRLEELIHLHLKWAKANRSHHSYVLRAYAANTFRTFMGPCLVSDITRLKLSQFYDHVRAKHSRRNNGGNHYYREVKTMLLWAEEYEVCELPVKHFPPMRHTPPRTLRFTDEEIGKLLACIPEGDFKDMLLFGLMTGLRPQEIRTLKKEEIMSDGHGHSYVLIEVHVSGKMKL